MTFKLLLFLITSYLCNHTAHTNPLVQNTLHNVITIAPTYNTSVAISSGYRLCLNKTFEFNDLQPNKIVQAIQHELLIPNSNIINIVAGNLTDTTFENLRCGLLITKNPDKESYALEYGFFNKTYCSNKSENICLDSKNCSSKAIKCCDNLNNAFSCNLYGLAPNNSQSCMQKNKTQCFAITDFFYLPTEQPTNNLGDNIPTKVVNFMLIIYILLFYYV